MTSIVIPANSLGSVGGPTQPFGGMTNNMTAMLYALNGVVGRLSAAVGVAASNYSGTAGTEYEGAETPFGVVANATPGEQGAAYAFAVNTIAQNWQTFWTAAEGAINTIDNGQRATV